MKKNETGETFSARAKVRNLCTVLVQKPEGKRSLGRISVGGGIILK
jgi:hypothetical protein